MILLATGEGIRDADAQAYVDLRGRAVTALTRDRSAGRWSAVLERRTVLTGVPGGGWEERGETPGPPLTCLAAVGGRVLVGAGEARLFEVADRRLRGVGAFDDAPGRDGWYTPWGGPPAVRSIAVGEDGAWYVNVHVGGILRSDDGGRSFVQLVDPDVDVHEVVARDGLVAAACGAGGALLSTDRGDRWATVTEGLHAAYCRAVAVDDGHVLVSASTGPRGDRGAVYRGPLPAGPFERCEVGLPGWFDGNVDTGWLDADGGEAAFAAPGGRVYVTSDAGGTWRLVDGGLRDVAALVVAGPGGDGPP